MKANIRGNASNAVYERNTCVLCSTRPDTCVLYAVRFLLLVDAISTSKSKHRSHRFNIDPSFPPPFSLSLFQRPSLFLFSSLSLFQGLGSSLRRNQVPFVKTCRMCIQNLCGQYYHHESLKSYELIKLYIYP